MVIHAGGTDDGTEGGQTYHVRGVSPGTGKIIDLTIVAPTPMDAKRSAEESGLLLVTVDHTPIAPE